MAKQENLKEYSQSLQATDISKCVERIFVKTAIGSIGTSLELQDMDGTVVFEFQCNEGKHLREVFIPVRKLYRLLCLHNIDFIV